MERAIKNIRGDCQGDGRAVGVVMNLSEYQKQAARTAAKSGDDQLELLISAVGLVGESGEVADALKKHVGHGKRLDCLAIAEDLGDVMWYCADIARRTNLDLGTIAHNNLEKLKQRYPDGFTPAAAKQATPVNRKNQIHRIARLLDEISNEWEQLANEDIDSFKRRGVQDTLGTLKYWIGQLEAK